MKKSVFLLTCLCSTLIMGLGIYQFSKVYAYSESHFSQGTLVNGVDCSGNTAEEASVKLTEAWNEKSIIFTQDGVTVGTLSGFDFEYDIMAQLNQEIRPGVVHPLMQKVTHSRHRVKVLMNVKEPTESLTSQIGGFEFLNVPFTVETTDAYVDKSNTDFNIIPEVQGDNVDPDVFLNKTLEYIAKGTAQVEFRAEDYYAKPKVFADNKDLVAEQDYCKKFLTQKITYQFHTGNVVVTPAELETMLVRNSNGVPDIDKEKVEAFVTGLAHKYNTIGTARSFKTANGSVITVKGGSYGYALDINGEKTQLIADLEAKKDVTREPVYARRPYHSGPDEIGPSYIEVSLSTQHLWVFRDGNQVLSTPIVTGSVQAGKATPTGIYTISYLDRSATLRGPNDDGTTYAFPVDYWMPFNGDIGFHDAPWRAPDDFGGDIYISRGSHGCVNMPVGAAATMFNNIKKGYPVVVHY